MYMFKIMLLSFFMLMSFQINAKNSKGKKNMNPVVEMKTTMGNMAIKLNKEKAPQTVDNFLAYVNSKFYDGTIFHRVIPGFMIQGGGFVNEGKQMVQKETKEPVKNEAKNGLKNKRGTIAMARTQDPHSATTQFFINHKDNDNLDYPSFDGWGYAVFGELIEGEDVLDKIAKVKTGDKGMHQNVPVEDVKIISVQLKE